ncbi:Uncharacterized protein dnm_030980 [Desulfonema magnum]|uniref:Uncharacterized protein n=1 Tax=Desulfonema magnum TaxID=45655 RepID=A0A975GMN1_9BACT|nr:Uncharacterized protein dnm_030980 [Desulfonema magnum]
MFEKLRPMPPNIFAKKVLDMVARHKPIIIIPSWWRLFWRIHRLFPSFGISPGQKFFS